MKAFPDMFCEWYRVVFSTIACYIVIVAFDFLSWAGPLAPGYAAVEAMRVPAEIKAVQEQWFPILELFLAISITAFYYCWRHKSLHSAQRPSRASLYRDGLGFGGFIGLFMGLSMTSLFLSLDIPGVSPIIWAMTGFAKGVLLGLTLTAIHPKPTMSQS